MKPFLEAITDGPVLFDGAMGSLLYERGVLHTRSYDELNISQPDLVRSIHRDYLAAGAQVIESNTFGCNRISLARHGLAEQAAALCRAGVALAREVAGDSAWVGGAVGPTGVRFSVATAAERRVASFALAEQIDTMVLAGVDLALASGLRAVKLNAVLLRGLNDDELPAWRDYLRDRRTTLRFIELMQTGDNREYFQRHHLRSDALERSLLDDGWSLVPRLLDAGPAREYSHPESLGRIGIIAPYSRDFCAGCNRLRVTGALSRRIGEHPGSDRRHAVAPDRRHLCQARVHESIRFDQGADRAVHD